MNLICPGKAKVNLDEIIEEASPEAFAVLAKALKDFPATRMKLKIHGKPHRRVGDILS